MNEHKVAIYIRVGNKSQAETAVAVKQQRFELEKFAQEHNMTVVGCYYDIGYSGADLNRPGLKSILADGTKKKFASVLVP